MEAERLILRGSLVRRLVVSAAGWALGLLLIGAFALTVLYRETVYAELDDRLNGISDALVAGVELDPVGEVRLSRSPIDPRYDQLFSGRYWQVSDPTPPGAATPSLVRSASLWDEILTLPASVEAGALANTGPTLGGNGVGPDGEPLRLRVRAVRLPNRDDAVIITVAEDRRKADRQVRNFALTSALLLGVVAAVLAAGIIFQVRVGLAPVFRMRRDVAKIRDGQAERIEGDYPSELYPLAGELNALLDHSKEVVERARTHVGNLAHALKTPLSVLANEAHMNEGALAELVGRQTRAMRDQVDHHLRRARAAANARAIGASTPVHDVLDGLGRTLQRIHARNDIKIEWKSEGELFFRGERQDLEDLLGNLMDNACKWSRGHVRVLAKSSEDAQLSITVEDNGPGLSDEECKAVLARGVRLDEQSPGSGLGLAIVTDLAKVYGGSLTLCRSDLGGLRACLALPLIKSGPLETSR